jgi:hypothetical protein
MRTFPLGTRVLAAAGFVAAAIAVAMMWLALRDPMGVARAMQQVLE